jgi:hypothetical protein
MLGPVVFLADLVTVTSHFAAGAMEQIAVATAGEASLTVGMRIGIFIG